MKQTNKINLLNISTIKKNKLLLQREIKNIIRNPLDLKLKFVQILAMSLIILAVFYELEDSGMKSVQNRNGLIYFLLFSLSISGVIHNLVTFNIDKDIFLREKGSNYYGVFNYFISKTMADFPVQVILPTIFITIIYFGCHLNLNEPDKYFIALGIVILSYYSAGSLGLFLSSLFTYEFAITIMPLLFAPLMLLSGYLINLNNVSLA